MRLNFLLFYLIFANALLAMSQNITVSSYQKINELNGGFGGVLDNEDNFGVSIDKIEDLDGNGVDDLIVGSFSDDDGGQNKGAVWILFMDNSNNVINETKISNTSGGFTGVLDNNDRFGGAVAYLGDLNSDGKIEVAVGADYDGDGGTWKGAVWILSLNADGTVFSYSKISSTSGNFTGNINGDAIFGTDIENIGDLNGDGIDDIAVGSRRDNDGGGNEGAVWIIFLNSNLTVSNYQKISETSGGLGISLDFEDYFGGSIANLGDLNGDGITDIAVGSYRDDDGLVNSGAIYILFLNQNGTVNSTQKLSNSQGGFFNEFSQGAFFGESIDGISDRDADGKIEIIVGAMKQFNPTLSTFTGGFYIIELNSDGTISEFEFYTYNENCFEGQLQDGDLFGGSVSMLSDSSFAIGSYRDSENGYRKGAVWILNISEITTVDVDAINPTTCGVSDGSITFSGFIPNTSYTVSFDYDGQSEVWISNSNSFGEIILTNLNHGLYTNINITQNNSLNCSVNADDVELLEEGFVLNFSVNSNTDCGTPTGSILITNLDPNKPYVYDYELNGEFFSGSFTSDVNGEWIIDGLPAGNYEFLMVIDEVNSCTDGIDLLTITSPTLSAGIETTNPTLCNQNDGSIVFTNLTAGLFYNIDYNYNGSAVTFIEQADGFNKIYLNSLESGFYENVFLTENISGCSQGFNNVTLDDYVVDYNFSSINPSSCNASDGSILITGLLPNNDYNISYEYNGVSFSDLVFSSDSGEISITSLVSGSYQNIIVENMSDGCTDYEDEIIITSVDFNANIDFINPTGCNNSDGVIIISDLENSSNYTISFVFQMNTEVFNLVSNSLGEINLTELSIGDYSNIILVDNTTGCSVNLDSVELVSSSLIASISSTNPTSCENMDGSITISGLDSLVNYTLNYEFNGLEENLSLVSNVDGDLNVTGLSSGFYDDILVVEESTGCFVEFSAIDFNCFETITSCLKVKNFFTPNNDTINDVWMVEIDSNSCDFILYIFDRYGKLLKTLTPKSRFWDGTFNGYNMPTNDYWYSVEFIDKNGEKQQLKSHFTLKR